MKKSFAARQSGIELLKIIAILLIVLNHMVQTLTETNGLMPDTSYVVDICSNTTNIQTLILAILRSSGCVGNDIFVICSAWFLLDSSRCDKRKVSFLICNVWTVSVLIFFITLALGCDLDRDSTLKQFFPIGNSNNWFITCYILFFLIHPLLNRLIRDMSQKALLSVAAAMAFLYAIVNYFRPWFFNYAPYFMNDLIVWIMMYFVLAYVKLYLTDFQKNTRANAIGLLIGILGQALMIVLTNEAGLRISMLANKLQYWNYGGSPFIIMTAICSFNLMRRIQWKSRLVNFISGLSLLIYVIHENYIIVYNYRPWIFDYIHKTFGYDHIVLWVILLVPAIFILAAIISALYSVTIERLVKIVSDKIYDFLFKIWERASAAFMKLR